MTGRPPPPQTAHNAEPKRKPAAHTVKHAQKLAQQTASTVEVTDDTVIVHINPDVLDEEPKP